MNKFKSGQMNLFGGNQMLLPEVPEPVTQHTEPVVKTCVDLRGRNAKRFEVDGQGFLSPKVVYKHLVLQPMPRKCFVQCEDGKGNILAVHEAVHEADHFIALFDLPALE